MFNKPIPYGIENGNILIYHEFVEKVFDGNVDLCLSAFNTFVEILECMETITISKDEKYKVLRIRVQMK